MLLPSLVKSCLRSERLSRVIPAAVTRKRSRYKTLNSLGSSVQEHGVEHYRSLRDFHDGGPDRDEDRTLERSGEVNRAHSANIKKFKTSELNN